MDLQADLKNSKVRVRASARLTEFGGTFTLPTMPSKILLAFLSLSLILNSPATTTSQECPYPCYPPPTGTGNVPPATPTPPSQTGYNPPPAFNPPPIGFLPNSPPPPYFVNGAAPPPPDPVVPWFPYYYKKPPHGTDQSSSTPLRGWTAVIASTPLLVFIYFLLFC